jgi:uncharacterized short protein YbdD (DUF466 family)
MNAHHSTCHHGDAQVPVRIQQPTALTPSEAPRRWYAMVFAYLRRWSGDDAYERYLAEHQHHGHQLLSRREFYRRYLDHRAGGSRCC